MQHKQAIHAVIAAFVLAAASPVSVMAAPRDTQATATRTGQMLGLEASAIGAHWSVAGGRIGGLVVTDHLHAARIPIPSPFAILMKDGTVAIQAALAQALVSLNDALVAQARAVLTKEPLA